jgi:hypothetical protein
MNEENFKLDNLKNKLSDLHLERKKLLRGLGNRFSRKIKPLAYDKSLFNSKQDFEFASKNRVKKAQNGIKKSKFRIEQISDEISDIKQKIKELEIENFKSSSNFNNSYRNSLKMF